MKKVICLVLSALMMLTLVSLVGCGGNVTPDETTTEAASALKFGLGVSASYAAATDADGETDGKGEVVVDIAAVSVDADGKIVSCVIDTADTTVKYTSAGAVVEAGEFATKGELGENYGMAAYGTDLDEDGTVLEWDAQVDAFCKVVVGKTIAEVSALVVDGYGSEEVVAADCTIAIAGFVKALEKAVANATDSDVTADSVLKLGVVTTAEGKDASDESEGEYEVDTAIVAVALDKDGKVVVAETDTVAAVFGFDTKGASTVDTTVELKTKREKGDEYGMAAYGTDLNGDGKVLEWYAQADLFDTACKGLTADEIAALALETGYGAQDVQIAGCTMNIYSIVAAAVKAATVA